MLRLKASPASLFRRMVMILMAGLLLAACGPLGDDDKDPTATSETIAQPTTATTSESTATEASEEIVPPGTPEAADGSSSTPLVEQPVVPTTETVKVSTPAIPDDQSGTPEVDEATPVVVSGAPLSGTDSSTGDEAQFSDSDGTSGAVPDQEVAAEATPSGDEPLLVPEVATPVPGASPVALADADLDDLQPVTVTSCDVVDVPAVAIEQRDYITAEDVNFRTGPGADCDLIGTGPIGINAAVTLLGGPVVREGDDDFVWVQVEIAGDTGWVITDVLDPAS